VDGMKSNGIQRIGLQVRAGANELTGQFVSNTTFASSQLRQTGR